MRIIENTTEFHLENKSAVALGKFDGIHLGHRRLLERVLEQKSQGLWTVVFTFDTSAASFFGGETKELSTREEKRAVFSRLGIDVLIEFPLNRGTAATEPAEFVARYLAEQMRTAYLCAGPDISFGKGGAGDYKLLSEYAGTCGYQVELIDKVRVDGEEVSSTRVRQAVREGDMEKVSVMLGPLLCERKGGARQTTWAKTWHAYGKHSAGCAQTSAAKRRLLFQGKTWRCGLPGDLQRWL